MFGIETDVHRPAVAAPACGFCGAKAGHRNFRCYGTVSPPADSGVTPIAHSSTGSGTASAGVLWCGSRVVMVCRYCPAMKTARKIPAIPPPHKKSVFSWTNSLGSVSASSTIGYPAIQCHPSLSFVMSAAHDRPQVKDRAHFRSMPKPEGFGAVKSIAAILRTLQVITQVPSPSWQNGLQLRTVNAGCSGWIQQASFEEPP